HTTLGEGGLELRRERPAVRHVQEIRHVNRLLIPEDLVLDHRLQREHMDQQLAEDEGARGECRGGDPVRRIALTRRFTDREPAQPQKAKSDPYRLGPVAPMWRRRSETTRDTCLEARPSVQARTTRHLPM